MGLTGLRTGHTAGGCAFARQAQAVLLWLIPLSRTLDIRPPHWGSDVRAHSLLTGIPGLGGQPY